MQVLQECLLRWKKRRLWLQLLQGLRTRVLLKGMQALTAAANQHRLETLESWLEYWEHAEDMVHGELQARLSPGKGATGINAQQAGQVALAQVLTSTPDTVKYQVLWELYWLLKTQTAIQKHAHWMRWRALLRQRRIVRKQLANPLQPSVNHAVDFMHDEPVSLRALNAALFVLALQTPHFRYRMGKEVTLKELVRFASAPQRVCSPNEADTLRHASAVITAFVDSPLCSDPAWLYRRYGKASPLIPPRTWRVDAFSPRHGFSGEELADRCGEDWPTLRVLEERSSLLQQRRLRGSLSSSIPSMGSPRQSSPMVRKLSHMRTHSNEPHDRAPSCERTLRPLNTFSSPSLNRSRVCRQWPSECSPPSTPLQPATPLLSFASRLRSPSHSWSRRSMTGPLIVPPKDSARRPLGPDSSRHTTDLSPVKTLSLPPLRT
eukprot:GGOE01008028.1.p1 GENE.GGOE01008028.1~~GGOE01008028.1.p1  ORF type:complete len:434 (-),score=69.49 GGOE01008028.1:1384-2685(-)